MNQSPHPGPDAKPEEVRPPFLFIVGRGRSGTTLLRAMFDTHPEMAIPPESHFIAPLMKQRRRYERDLGFETELFIEDLEKQWFRSWGIPENELRSALLSVPPASCADAIRAVFAAYAALRLKRRYGEKTPINVRNIPFLAHIFPEAVFVHLIRDGRDVTMSYLDVPWGPTSVAESAVYWRLAVEKGRRAGLRLPSHRYREVRYEHLIEDPERILRELCDFAEIVFDPVMLTYHERSRELIGGSKHHKGVGEPPTKGMRNWRREMNPRDLAIFESLAGRTLERLGYDRALRRLPMGTRLRAACAAAGVHLRRLKKRATHARMLARS